MKLKQTLGDLLGETSNIRLLCSILKKVSFPARTPDSV